MPAERRELLHLANRNANLPHASLHILTLSCQARSIQLAGRGRNWRPIVRSTAQHLAPRALHLQRVFSSEVTLREGTSLGDLYAQVLRKVHADSAASTTHTHAHLFFP